MCLELDSSHVQGNDSQAMILSEMAMGECVMGPLGSCVSPPMVCGTHSTTQITTLRWGRFKGDGRLLGRLLDVCAMFKLNS